MTEPAYTEAARGAHSAERLILIGCHDAAHRPDALRLLLHPETRTEWVQQTQRFLLDTVKYDSTSLSLFVDPQFDDWPETRRVTELAEAHYGQARIAQATVEQNAERMGVNFVRNLVRMAHASPTHGIADAVASYTQMLRDETVVVVGAGPSLDEDLEVLAQHAGPVIAVNTSVGALHGRKPLAAPDIVVCMECRPVPEGVARIDPECSLLALDMTAHPDNASPMRDVSNGYAGLAMYVGCEPNLAPYAKRLGMLPLAYGGSCTTAAVSLALACGAARVLLVGQDCAFQWGTPEVLRMYARGTPYEATQVLLHPERNRAEVHKMGASTAAITAAITAASTDTHWVDIVEAPGIDGAPVLTTPSMLGFALWYRDLPDSVRRRITNCTSSGVHIEGLRHTPLRECITKHWLAEMLPAPASSAFTERAHRTLAHLVDVARNAGVMKRDAQLIEWAAGHTLLNLWVAPEVLRMRREALTTAQRGRRKAEAIRRACADILKHGHA